MKLIRLASAFLLGLFLVACGGGGAGAGTSSFGTGSGGTGTGTGTTATPSLLLAISSTTATTAAPATVTAALKDASGAGIAGQVISFSTVGSLGAFNVATALTDASGNAVVRLTPASSTSNGADLVLAKATVGTAALTQTIGFQVSPGSGSVTTGPSVSIALSTTAISTTTPATVTAVVKDAVGVGIPGQIVKFTTASSGLGSFAVASALTDATGTATSILNAASVTAKGADLAIAQVTVGGTLVTSSAGFAVASVGSVAAGAPSIALALSTTTVTAATPATVTATVKDATGSGLVGQVVRFTTVDGRGALTPTSALTNNVGVASVSLAAASSSSSGADQVVATTTVNGTALQASQGFQLTATNVSIAGFTSGIAAGTLSAYGQTNLTVALAGAAAGSTVNVAVSSACVAKGKATLTPATVATTTGTASFTYRDVGCGATDPVDTLQASIVGTTAISGLSVRIASPSAQSITFVSASPQTIFLKGSGFTESSSVAFQVLDSAGNGLPNQTVVLEPSTLTGDLTIEGGSVPVSKLTDSLGNVSVRINSGTVPTPVRVKATLASSSISTVSSSLAIAVGLPSQLNFSFSQTTLNIEGGEIDGTANTYNIIASDRLGNPVPVGTAINFIASSGQVEPIKFIALANGLARTSANFVSASPRPANGRITVLAYAIGEESFTDLNGNNTRDAGEPFQDLGNVFLDRNSNGIYDSTVDQFIALSLPGGSAGSTACAAPADRTIPSVANTCDGAWGRAYVRRSAETVLSTSSGRPLFIPTAPGFGLGQAGLAPGNCSTVMLATDTNGSSGSFYRLGAFGPELYKANATGTFDFIVADANTVQLNPMAAGTTISVTGTTGLTVSVLGGSPVPSTNVASLATISYAFATGIQRGTATITFTSPGGTRSSVNQVLTTGTAPLTACP